MPVSIHGLDHAANDKLTWKRRDLSCQGTRPTLQHLPSPMYPVFLLVQPCPSTPLQGPEDNAQEDRKSPQAKECQYYLLPYTSPSRSLSAVTSSYHRIRSMEQTAFGSHVHSTSGPQTANGGHRKKDTSHSASLCSPVQKLCPLINSRGLGSREGKLLKPAGAHAV